jgi:hypothetical protein
VSPCFFGGPHPSPVPMRTMRESMPPFDAEPVGVMLKGTARLLELAPKMWTHDYRALFQAEFEENEAHLASMGVKDTALPPSSYRQRLRGDAACQYDDRQRARRRDHVYTRLFADGNLPHDA